MPEGVKTSRMLDRLDAEVFAAKSTVEADCKRIERAAYKSRLGQFTQSRAELEAMREKYKNSPNIVITCWQNLVEGVMGHLKNMDVSARTKILRAHALSSAANLPNIRALSAAWLAHMDYLQVDVISMAVHATEALRIATERGAFH